MKRNWEPRTEYLPGAHNIRNQPLVSANKIILPPLHIKLGLFKNFVKTLNIGGQGFAYIRKIFSNVSDAKVKAGVFTGPQIRKLLNDSNFVLSLNVIEKAAWISFKSVVDNFLGNKKSPDYREIIGNMIENYRQLDCRMSLKLHFMHSHLDFFPENLGAMSDEHGERFHQEISSMKQR